MAKKTVEFIQKVVCPEYRPDGANTMYEDDVLLGSVCLFHHVRGELVHVHGAGQCFEKSFIALPYLHIAGLIQELAIDQVVTHDLQQIDGGNAQVAVFFGQEVGQKSQVFAHLEFFFRGIVEDLEANFIAQTLSLKKFFGKDFVRNLV